MYGSTESHGFKANLFWLENVVYVNGLFSVDHTDYEITSNASVLISVGIANMHSNKHARPIKHIYTFVAHVKTKSDFKLTLTQQFYILVLQDNTCVANSLGTPHEHHWDALSCRSSLHEDRLKPTPRHVWSLLSSYKSTVFAKRRLYASCFRPREMT